MLKRLFFLASILTPFMSLAQDITEDVVKNDEDISAEASFIEGMKEYIAENYAKSANIFEGVIKKHTPTAGMYHMLSKAYLQLNNLNDASVAAKETLNLEKDNTYYQTFYADILTQLLDYDGAIDLYKKVIRKNPLDIATYILLSEIYIVQEEYDDAIKLYNQVEKNIGSDEEISHRKQMLYLRQNKVDEAIKEGDRLMESQPLDPEYVLNQAQIMIGNQKLPDAEKLLLNHLKNDPNLAEGHVLLADIYRRFGDINACHEQLELAFENPSLESEIKLKVLGSFIKLVEEKPDTESINNAISLTQDLIDIDPKLAGAYVFMGDLLMKKGRLEEARENYVKSTEFDKSVFEVWLAIVELDTKTENLQNLVKDAGKAAEYFPNQAFFWYHFGYGNVLIKDYEEAIYALEEARNLSFDKPELLKHILSLLGDSYNATKQYTDSERAYEEALKMDPEYLPVLNNYSYFLALRNKNLPKAQEMSKRLVSLSPSNVDYLDTRAWVLFRAENYLHAKEVIESAVIYAKDVNGTVLEHYGDILYKLGDKPQALEQWKKAKLLGENSKTIDQKISEQKYIE
ncbi:tetratricopeptide repeat protein [uncultured Arcticibacterium sp.]|uniref:tetratricopeptide repeat protein n=1 Tax=uncultured Arcticibacterium sp. TaxID=2173042 RepID=UPI0030F626E9